MKYYDDSGDLISVKSEEEFKMMVFDLRASSAILLHLSRRRQRDTSILETMINPVVVIDSVRTAPVLFLKDFDTKNA